MSSTIDERVVELKFDNKDFEQNVKVSMNTLDYLKSKLDTLDGTKAGVEEISKSLKGMNFNGVANNVEGISSRFSTLGIIGMTALQNITTSVMNLGKTMLSKLISPLNQIKSGGMTRALNIEQARFQLKGLQLDVDAVMANVSDAVQGTAYGLDEAAKIAAQFGASGLKAGDQMRNGLLAVAGAAAMTGSSFGEIGQIFATIAGQGKVMTMQLRQFESRGLNAAAAMAKQMNTTEDAVREMVHDGEINFEQFSDMMYKAFGEHAKEANDTFEGSLSNMRAAMSRIGADFAGPYLEHMRQGLHTVTEIYDAIRKTVTKPIAEGPYKRFMEQLEKSFYYFSINKGPQHLADGLKLVAETIMSIVKPISKAWEEIFPTKLWLTAWELVNKFGDFTKHFKLTGEAAKNLKDTFKGLFSILKLFGTIIKSILNALIPFGDPLNTLGGTILRITGFIGRLITAETEWITKNNYIGKGLKVIATALASVVNVLFLGVDAVIQFVTSFGQMPVVLNILDAIVTIFQKIGQFLSPVTSKIAEGIDNIVMHIQELWAMSPVEFASYVNDKLYEMRMNFDSLVKSIKEFIGNVRDLGINQAITIALDKAGLSAENFKNKIDEMTNGTILEGLTAGLENLKNKLKSIMLSFGETGAMILDFAKKYITPSNLIIGGFTVSLIYLIFRMGLLAKSIGRLADRARVFSLKSLLGIGTRNSYQNYRDIAISIALIAGSLVALANVPYDKLKQAATVLGIFAGSLAGFIIVINLLNKIPVKSGSGIPTMTTLLISLAGSVAMLVMALKTLNEIDLGEDYKKKLAIIAAMAVGMGALAIVISKVAPSLSTGSIFFVSFAASLYLLVKVFKELNEADLQKLSDNIKPLTMILVGFGVMCRLAGSMSLSSALGIILLALALKKIYDTFVEVLNDSNFKKVQNCIASHLVLFQDIIKWYGGLLLIAAVAGKKMTGVGLAMTLIGTSLLIVAKFIKELISVPESAITKATGLLKSLGAFFSAIIIFTGISNKLSGGNANFLKMAASVIAISASLLIVIKAIKKISEINGTDLAKGLVVIGILTGLLGGLIVLTSKAKGIGLGTVIAIVIGISIMLGEMLALTYIPIDKLIPAVTSLAGLLISFGVAVALLGKFNAMKINIPAVLVLVLGVIGFVKVMEKLAKYSWDQLLSVAGSISGILLALSACTVILSKGGFKDIKKVGRTATMLAALCTAFLAVGMSLALIMNTGNFSNPGQVATVTGCIIAALLGLSACVVILSKSSLTRSTRKAILNAGLMVGLSAAFLALGMSLALIMNTGNFSNLGQVATVTGCITAALLGLSACVDILSASNFKNISEVGRTATMLGAAVLAFLGIGMSLALIMRAGNFSNPTQVSTVTGCITVALLGLSACIKILSMANFRNIDEVGTVAASLVVLILAFGAIGSELAALISLGVWSNGEEVKTCLNAVLETLAVMSLIVLAFGRFGKGSSGAIEGVVTVLAVIGLIGAVMGAIGSLLNAFGAGDTAMAGLETGMNLLVLLCEKLGEAMGAVISGIGKGLTSQLPAIGANISAFGTSISPFFALVKSWGNDVAAGVGYFTAAILALTGASFLEGLASLTGIPWIGLQSGISMLETIAPAMVNFVKTLSAVSNDDMLASTQSLANVCKALADFPTTGGLMSIVSGEKMSFDGLGDALTELAKGVASFSNQSKGVILESVQRGVEASKMIIDLNKSMYGTGGLVQGIFGEKDLATYGNALTQWIGYVKTFGDKSKNIVVEDVEKGATASQYVVGLNKGMYGTGGWKQTILGDKDLPSYGEGLVTWAQHLNAFANACKGLAIEAVQRGADASNMVVGLANNLAGTGGVLQYWTGEKRIDQFGAQLKQFALEMTWFGYYGGQIDIGGLTNAVTASKGILEIGRDLQEYSSATVSVQNLSVIMEEIMPLIQDLSNALANFTIDTAKLSSFIRVVRGLVDVTTAIRDYSQAIASTETTGVAEFSKFVSDLIDQLKVIQDKITSAGLNTDQMQGVIDFIQGLINISSSLPAGGKFEIDLSGFELLGGDMINNMITGLSNNEAAFSTAIDSIITNIETSGKIKAESAARNICQSAIDTINTMASNFKTAAEACVNQFIQGLSNSGAIQRACQAATKLVNETIQAAVKASDPGEAGDRMNYEVATPMVKQFNKGLNDGVEPAKKSASNFVNSTIGTIKSGVDKYAPGIKSGITSIKDTVVGLATGQVSATGIFEEYTSAMGLNTDAANKNAEASEKTAESVEKVAASTKKATDEVKINTKALTEFMDKLSQKIESSMDIFSEWTDKEAISADKMLSNMRSQIKGVMDWSKNIASLAAKGLDEGLIQKLADLGPQGADKVAAFASMTNEQILEANQLFQQSLMLPDAAATYITSSFTGIGADILQGLLNGMDSRKSKEAGFVLGKAAVDGTAEGAGCQSPSTITYETGNNIDEGLKKGLEDNSKKAETAAENVGKRTVNVFKKMKLPDQFRRVANECMNGFIIGLSEKEEELDIKIKIIGEKVKRAIQESQQVESPSKFWRWIGNMDGEGLVRGLEDYRSKVTSAASDLGYAANNSLGGSISKVIDDMSENGDFVIRPTLDLSLLTAQAQSIGSILNSNALLRASNQQTILAAANARTQQQPTQVFNQYNTSPKALSETEIYRQTKNLFSTAKG